ncbi:MAG: hypothetical protein ACE5K3_07520, partial [bacterium]
MEVKMKIDNGRDISFLCGKRDENLKIMEKELGVRFILRDDFLKVIGEKERVKQAEEIVEEIFSQLHKGYLPHSEEIKSAVRRIKAGEKVRLEEASSSVIFTSSRGRRVRPRTEGQRKYVEAMKNN